MITVYALSAFTPALKGVIRDLRAVWALEELGLPYERVVMDPTKKEHKQPGYLAIHPFGKVPALKDGDFCLFESAAICNYLGDKCGKLVPKPATRERALYDQWVCFSISTFEPVVSRIFGLDFFAEMDATKEVIRKESMQAVESFMQIIDGELAHRPYLAGQEFSMADVIFSSICRSVGHTEMASKHPNLEKYLAKNFSRPAFQRSLATQL